MACLRPGVRRGWLRGAKPGVEAEAVRVPPGDRGRGEDRRESVRFPAPGWRPAARVWWANVS